MKTLILLALIEVLSPRWAEHRPAQTGVEWIGSQDPVFKITKPAEVVLINGDKLEVEEGLRYEFYIPSLDGYFTGTVRTYRQFGQHWYWIELDTQESSDE